MSSNRIRVMLVSLLAVFAVSAVASASALAIPEFYTCQNAGAGAGHFTTNTCVTEGAPNEFEWKGIPAALNVEGTSGVSKLEGSVAGLKLIIECPTDKTIGAAGTNQIEPAGKNKGEIEFGPLTERCKLFEILRGNKKEITACKVAPIKFKFVSALITGAGSGPDIEFKPSGGGKLFVEIEIEAGCAGGLSGKHAVETKVANGGVVCALPEAEVGKEQHEIECSSTGDKELVFGASKASFFSVEKVKIVGGQRWLARN